jgi:hypothetical protein
MTAPVPLKYGLTALIITHAEIAEQQRAQAPVKAKRDDQLQLEEPEP